MFNLNIDRETPYNLQFEFAGKMFQWQYNYGFPNGVSNIQVKTSTGGQITHIISRTLRTASTGITFQFVENPIMATTGKVKLNTFNVDRLNPLTPKTIFATSSITASSGTIFENTVLVSGNTWQQLAPEIILKSNTNYNLRITNSGTSAKTLDFYFVWYESNN